MVCTLTHGIDNTHDIDLDSRYSNVICKDSWYWQGLMLKTWTHGIDNTHGIDKDSWYRISSPESHTYERAECYPYAGFLMRDLSS